MDGKLGAEGAPGSKSAFDREQGENHRPESQEAAFEKRSLRAAGELGGRSATHGNGTANRPIGLFREWRRIGPITNDGRSNKPRRLSQPAPRSACQNQLGGSPLVFRSALMIHIEAPRYNTEAGVARPTLPSGTREALLALAYYDIFQFPLRVQEVWRFGGLLADEGSVVRALDWLQSSGLVKAKDGFYFLSDESHVPDRVTASTRLAWMEPLIQSRARLIGRFPFVRGVGLSGTASKGILKPDDDIDFFVVTAPGRLWICRTLLMLFKRVAFLGSHRYFCINYFVSEDGLALPDRNIFTAMEIGWLRPLWGRKWYDAFIDANTWVEHFLPNWSRETRGVDVKAGLLKRGAERLFDLVPATKLDTLLQTLITRRNRVRYEALHGADFDVAFRSTRSSSKHHPDHHQGRVLELLQRKKAEWLERLATVEKAGT